MTTTVGSLFAKLGIDLDGVSFAKADAALAKLREHTERLSQSAQLRDALELVSGNAQKAASLVGLSFDATEIKAQRAAKRAAHWGKAVKGASQVASAAMAGVKWVGVGTAALYGVGKLADAYTGARSRINQLTDSTAQQVRLQDQLFASAQNTATAYDNVVELYQQTAVAAKANGRTLEQGAVIVDTINKAIKASGASADGASKALVQLGQGLGSGVLRGEEYNAVLEQAPILVDLIGKSIGKTRGQMRAMADSGQITSKMILKALESQKGAVDAAYAKRLPQVGDLFVRLRNTISKSLSEVFQKKEVVEGLTAAFKGLTTALVAVIQGVAAVALYLAKHPGVLKAVTAAVVALAAAFVAMKIAAVLAWLAALSPAIAVAAAIAGLIVAFILFRKQITKAFVWVSREWESLWNAIDSKIRSFGRGIESFFRKIGAGIKAGFHYIVNGVIAAINHGIRLLNKAIRLANKLPWVDLDQADELDRVGEKAGGGPLGSAAIRTIRGLTRQPTVAPVMPVRPMATMPTVVQAPRSRSVQVNNNGNVSITVNGAGDPEATARIVNQRMREMRDEEMNAAMADLGDEA